MKTVVIYLLLFFAGVLIGKATKADTLTYEDRSYALDWHGVLPKVPNPEAVLSAAQPTELLVTFAVNDAEGSTKFTKAYIRLKGAVISPDVTVIRSVDSSLPYAVVSVKSTTGLIRLLQRTDVLTVELNDDVSTNSKESFPIASIDRTKFSSYGLDGYGVTVGVIDTGIKLWRDNKDKQYPSTIPTTVGEQVVASVPCGGVPVPVHYYSSGNGNDTHGTAVAAVINAVAPKAKLVDLYMRRADNTAAENFRTDDLLKCLLWVERNYQTYNMRVLNISMASTGTYELAKCRAHPLSQVASRVAQKISVVVASGNTGENDMMPPPACAVGVISVAAVTDSARTIGCLSSDIYCRRNSEWQKKQIWPHSSIIGGVTSLAAPGCALDTPDSKLLIYWNQYNCGTSFAAPVVAGALALIQGAKGFSIPPAQAQGLLLATADTLVSKSYNNIHVPLVNVDYALEIGGLWLKPAPVNNTVGQMPTIRQPTKDTGESCPVVPPPGCTCTFTSPYYACTR